MATQEVVDGRCGEGVVMRSGVVCFVRWYDRGRCGIQRREQVCAVTRTGIVVVWCVVCMSRVYMNKLHVEFASSLPNLLFCIW